jgi:hypothetical protein
MKEAEEQALGEQALAEFSAMYGLDIQTGEALPEAKEGPLAPPLPTEKELGPRQ